MRVVCKTNRGCDVPKKIISIMVYENTVCSELKIGNEYTVYAISLYKGALHYMIEDLPSWYPAEFFQVTDRLIYNEWYFEFYGDVNGLNALWGYKELLDLTHYEALLEIEPEAQEIFAKRKQEMDEYEALSSYIPKRSDSVQIHDTPKSLVCDKPANQTKYLDVLKDFLEKYLNGKTGDQRFTWLYKMRYAPLIDYTKLTLEEEAIMKELRTVAENYAPDHINPKRVYSNEDEVRAAANKALVCVKNNPYLAALTRES